MKSHWFHACIVASVFALASGSASGAATGFTGFVFFDAGNIVAILRGKPGTTPADAWAILKGYNVTPETLESNDFLKQVAVLQAGSVTEAARTTSANTVAGAQAAIPGGLSETAIIDSIGSFIAQRFKQEAEIAAVQEIVAGLNKLDRSPKFNQPMTALLPRTMAFAAATAPGGLTATPTSWNTLTSDFRADFLDLGANIHPFLKSLYPANQPMTVRRYMFEIGATAAAGAIGSARTPNLIIDSVAAQSLTLVQPSAGFSVPTDLVTFNAALSVLALGSDMLTTRANSSPWTSADNLKAYLSAPAAAGVSEADAARILLGLAVAKDPDYYKAIKVWWPNHGSTLEASLGDRAKLSTFLNKVSVLFAAIAKDCSALPPIQSATVADARLLVDDLGGIAATSMAAIAVFEPSVQNPGVDDLKAITSVLDAIVEIKQYAQTGNYGGIISALIVVVPIVIPAEQNSPADGIEIFLTGPGQAIAAMAQAKNQTDFTAALDNYALPVGSYTQKQQSYESATLNGYFGVTAGAELLTGVSGTGVSRIAPHAGFTAPVGVAWNWGKANDGVAHSFLGVFDIGSESIFIPVIDVGAVASWRLGNGSGKLASVTWSNVVAPGVHFVWTAKNTPFSFMVGTQYGPQLRSVAADGGTTIQHAAWQVIAISFTFDIPVFNLYQKTRVTSN